MVHLHTSKHYLLPLPPNISTPLDTLFVLSTRFLLGWKPFFGGIFVDLVFLYPCILSFLILKTKRNSMQSLYGCCFQGKENHLQSNALNENLGVLNREQPEKF